MAAAGGALGKYLNHIKRKLIMFIIPIPFFYNIYIGIIGGIFIWFFGESRLNPWGFAHKVFRQEEDENVLLFKKINDGKILSRPQLSNESNERSSYAIDIRTQLLEHEISVVKSVINSYLLDTSTWKKVAESKESITEVFNNEVKIQNNLNWEKVY